MTTSSDTGLGMTLVYIIGTYPVLTTTFIDREIEALRRRGVEVRVVSLRHPHGQLSPGQSKQGVSYVRPASPLSVARSHLMYLARQPRTYLRTLRDLVTAPHPRPALRIKTLAHFGLAVHTARRVARLGHVDHIHAHFVDRAAVVALVVARFTGIPYSATAHANDIYVEPVLLDLKVSEAKFLATCTEANAEHIERLVPATGRIRVFHHGLDVGGYSVPDRSDRDRLVLLAVGQLKEKKGFTHLIEACRLLVDGGREFECEIVGEGPMRDPLQAAIAAAGLTDVVSLRGALAHEDVKAAYAAADVMVLPCVVASDGDRDGIPNVILEAMASGLPVVSSAISGIPEAIEDGVSGLLVAPGDPLALAAALGRLIDGADLRESFGQIGRKVVTESFDLDANVGRLLGEFEA